MIDAFVFDFDGLIVDTETPEYTVWRETFEAHGHELPVETWAACIGTIGGFDPVAELKRLTDNHIHEDVLDRMISRWGYCKSCAGDVASLLVRRRFHELID